MVFWRDSFSPSDQLVKGGMTMTLLDLMALISFSIAVFELGYLFGSIRKRK
jgi:hypothetical protein